MILRVLLFLAISMPVAHSQVTEVRAGFPNPVGVVGEVLTFVVSVEVKTDLGGKKPTMETPDIPQIEGLEFRFREGGFTGTQRQMSFMGGRRSGSLTHSGAWIWDVVAKRQGRYRVPGFDVLVAGKKHRTRPAALLIEKDAPGNRYVGTAVVVSTMTPYVHQPVTLRFVLSTERVPVQTRRSFPRLTIPWAGSPNGFKALPLVEADRRASAIGVQINDADQQVALPAEVKRNRTPAVIEITLNKTLIPLAAGKIDLGSTVASLEVARDRRNRGVFAGTEYVGKTRAVVKTEPIILEVRDAPLVGRPDSYRGVLGDFNADVHYGKGEIRAGDGVTLNLVLRGGEVLTLIEEPTIDGDFPDCRVLPSGRRLEGKGNRRTLTFSWLIKPLRDDLKELPRFDYTWFRPEGERFDTATTGPLPLTITGKLEEEEVFAGGSSTSEQIAIDTLGDGARPLMDEPGDLRRSQVSPLVPWALAVLLLPLCSLVATSIVLKKKRTLAGDARLGRKKRASKAAEARLAEARALLGGRGFYGKLSRSLAGFVADKLGVPPASVSAATARSLLSPHGLPEERMAAVVMMLNDLDMKEFGSTEATSEDQHEALSAVETLVRHLDKEIKS